MRRTFTFGHASSVSMLVNPWLLTLKIPHTRGEYSEFDMNEPTVELDLRTKVRRSCRQCYTSRAPRQQASPGPSDAY